MLHSCLLIVDVARAQDPATRVDTTIADVGVEASEFTAGHTAYRTERDAMFMVTLGTNGNYEHLPLYRQPLWVEFHPKPGALGLGDPPAFNYRTIVEHADPAPFPLLNRWVLGSHLAPPSHPFFKNEISEDDYKAALANAQPAVYYHPQPLSIVSDVSSKTVAITKVGPGMPKVTGLTPFGPLHLKSYQISQPWPEELSLRRYEGAEAGSFVHNIDDLNEITATGSADSYCVVTSRPPGIPQANMISADEADHDAMKKGCSQGCGRPGTVRYMTGPVAPVYSCFFCTFTSPSSDETYDHLDGCTTAIHQHWYRSEFQKVRRLPPLKSNACGHVFCTRCINVSILTRPPTAICPACGRLAATIKTHAVYGKELAKVFTGPLTTTFSDDGSRVLDLTEIFDSGNLFAHHIRRYVTIFSAFASLPPLW